MYCNTATRQPTVHSYQGNGQHQLIRTKYFIHTLSKIFCKINCLKNLSLSCRYLTMLVVNGFVFTLNFSNLALTSKTTEACNISAVTL